MPREVTITRYTLICRETGQITTIDPSDTIVLRPQDVLAVADRDDAGRSLPIPDDVLDAIDHRPRGLHDARGSRVHRLPLALLERGATCDDEPAHTDEATGDELSAHDLELLTGDDTSKDDLLARLEQLDPDTELDRRYGVESLRGALRQALGLEATD